MALGAVAGPPTLGGQRCSRLTRNGCSPSPDDASRQHNAPDNSREVGGTTECATSKQPEAPRSACGSLLARNAAAQLRNPNCPPYPLRPYAAPGLPAWATAPFRSFSAPDDCRTAPSTLSLRPSAVQVGFRGELACRGLHYTCTLGTARLHRGRYVPLSHRSQAQPFTSSRLWRVAHAISPPQRERGIVRVPCASCSAQRLHGGHRVSGALAALNRATPSSCAGPTPRGRKAAACVRSTEWNSAQEISQHHSVKQT